MSSDPNNVLRMSHTSESLLGQDYAPQSNALNASTRNSNIIEPNDFFAEDKSDGSDGEIQEMQLEFGPDPDKDSGFYVGEENEFVPMLNIIFPDLTTRIKLYLKPNKSNTGLTLFLLLLDTALAIFYLVGQIIFVFDGTYTEEQDKIV